METILKLWREGINGERLGDSSVREKIKGSSLGEKVEKEAEEFSESLSERQRELLLSYWQVES